MTDQTIKLIISGLAILSMLAGVFGMLLCAVFLWSSHMEDLVGAGFPFVGASILFGTGLITLAILHKPSR